MQCKKWKAKFDLSLYRMFSAPLACEISIENSSSSSAHVIDNQFVINKFVINKFGFRSPIQQKSSLGWYERIQELQQWLLTKYNVTEATARCTVGDVTHTYHIPFLIQDFSLQSSCLVTPPLHETTKANESFFPPHILNEFIIDQRRDDKQQMFTMAKLVFHIDDDDDDDYFLSFDILEILKEYAGPDGSFFSWNKQALLKELLGHIEALDKKLVRFAHEEVVPLESLLKKLVRFAHEELVPLASHKKLNISSVDLLVKIEEKYFNVVHLA